jgi:hypothetical protein
VGFYINQLNNREINLILQLLVFSTISKMAAKTASIVDGGRPNNTIRFIRTSNNNLTQFYL